jgi:hypothetical protein
MPNGTPIQKFLGARARVVSSIELLQLGCDPIYNAPNSRPVEFVKQGRVAAESMRAHTPSRNVCQK